MHHRTAVFGMLLCLAASPPVEAQTAGDGQAVAELLSLFGDFCLERFPNEKRIQAYIAAKHLPAVPDEQIRYLLDSDPGMGWSQSTDRGAYTITIELPPYHTCAFRKQFAGVPDVRAAYEAKVRAWGRTIKGSKIAERPVQELPEIGGIPSPASIFILNAPGIRENEALMAIVTPFPQGGSEVRLARAIGNR